MPFVFGWQHIEVAGIWWFVAHDCMGAQSPVLDYMIPMSRLQCWHSCF